LIMERMNRDRKGKRTEKERKKKRLMGRDMA
jgi:hypothetical protein